MGGPKKQLQEASLLVSENPSAEACRIFEMHKRGEMLTPGNLEVLSQNMPQLLVNDENPREALDVLKKIDLDDSRKNEIVIYLLAMAGDTTKPLQKRVRALRCLSDRNSMLLLDQFNEKEPIHAIAPDIQLWQIRGSLARLLSDVNPEIRDLTLDLLVSNKIIYSESRQYPDGGIAPEILQMGENQYILGERLRQRLVSLCMQGVTKAQVAMGRISDQLVARLPKQGWVNSFDQENPRVLLAATESRGVEMDQTVGEYQAIQSSIRNAQAEMYRGRILGNPGTGLNLGRDFLGTVAPPGGMTR